MAILKKIGIALAALIGLFMIIPLFISGDASYEQSVLIDAPAERVWNHVNTLEGMDSWSPWMAKDPNMKKEMQGQDGTVGAQYCWESENEEVGSGCQSIAHIEPGKSIATDLKFLEPYESEAKAYITLVSKGEQTEANWKFASTMPYPFRIMKLFMSMEDMLKEDFTKGLNTLKAQAEKNDSNPISSNDQ